MRRRKKKRVKRNKCGGRGFKHLVTGVAFFFFGKEIKIKLKLGGKNVWKKINRMGQGSYS